MDFGISDTHFGHTNIIRYCDRPFATIEEMDSALMRNWNDTVSKNDRVFHFGDFCFKYNDEKIKWLLSQLNGYKILIMGNHDRRVSPKKWMELGFDEVYPYPIIYQGFYMFSHEPMVLNRHMPYANLYGHLHEKKMEGEGYYNMCVENNGYRPVPLEDVFKTFDKGE